MDCILLHQNAAPMTHFFAVMTIKRRLARYPIVFKRYIIISVMLVSALVEADAQYDASFSHYFDMEPSFNAGAVGKESKLNITAAYAIQLAGFEHNPNTMYAAADLPFMFVGAMHGAGLQFMSDNIGLFSHQRIGVQYAYKHRLLGGMLSVGMGAALLSEGFDGSKVDAGDSGDPALPTSDATGHAFDIGAGIYYTHRQWYVGVSATHLTSPTVELGETNELRIEPTYYATGGYAIQLRNPLLKVRTSALVRTDGTAWRGDVTARLVYTNGKKLMYGGVGYSPTNSVTLLVGGQVHGVHLGYSYECYTSAIGIGNGSHELFVGYQLDLNLIKKGKNKHKSVRIL